MFTPKWKKDAKLLNKGALKFLNYKRDLLKADRIAEIQSRRRDLAAAVKANDSSRAAEASKQLHATCENALPMARQQSWLEENVEVLFVAIVIALGLRAYVIQPFRIPTGSMQPTLNGIRGEALPREQWPAAPVRWFEKLTKGRSYLDIRTEEPKVIARNGIEERSFLHFFTRTYIHFEDGSQIYIPAPRKVVLDPNDGFGLIEKLNSMRTPAGTVFLPTPLPAGTVLAQGYVDTGDLVLVDKVSYHFRRPERGEVFVFETRGIRGIAAASGDQAGGSHYIKRLVGVPGDELRIDSPYLYVNGKIASEPGIVRVMEQQDGYAQNPGYMPDGILNSPERTLALRKEGAAPGLRQYAAFGDNTGNSLDSRYWGTVPEFNLVGPALFSLWPIQTGHWGFIR